ncbi:hypothetical protein ElyMa_001356600 [Elysia marginata]|uniref:Uncharacterized protein n=1 Tax=Elysia marginata TaxID=1093978 RepID=A0AAV4IQ01_9GAST|nr:hypothetical protein ElyMa_001356600 [Elysia marginata]
MGGSNLEMSRTDGFLTGLDVWVSQPGSTVTAAAAAAVAAPGMVSCVWWHHYVLHVIDRYYNRRRVVFFSSLPPLTLPQSSTLLVPRFLHSQRSRGL